MSQWYYMRAEVSYGPISTEEMFALERRGGITAETQVKRGDGSPWMNFSEAGLTAPPPMPVVDPVPPSTRTVAAGIKGPPWYLWASAVITVPCLGVQIVVVMINALIMALNLVDQSLEQGPLLTVLNLATDAVMWSNLSFFVVLITWQGCAFGSLKRLYGEGMLSRGSGSGFWWVTPFANFVMPYACLKELRHYSRKQRNLKQVGFSAGALVAAIQTVYLTQMVIHVADRLAGRRDTLTGLVDDDPSRASLVLGILKNLTVSLFVSLLAVFVMVNLIQQIRLYRDWDRDI